MFELLLWQICKFSVCKYFNVIVAGSVPSVPDTDGRGLFVSVPDGRHDVTSHAQLQSAQLHMSLLIGTQFVYVDKVIAVWGGRY